MKNILTIIMSIVLVVNLLSCVGNFQYYDVGKIQSDVSQHDSQFSDKSDDKVSNDKNNVDINIDSVDVVSDYYGEYFEDMRYPKLSCSGNEALDRNLKSLTTELENDVIGFNNQNKEFIGNSLNAGLTLEEWNRYSYTIDAEVTKNDGEYLSILLKVYSYTGGAHPNYLLIGHTYDVNTGKETTIYDFVKDKEEFRSFLKNWVDEHKDDGLYDDAKETVDKYIDNPPNDFGIDYNIDYYLDKDGMHVIFQAYELAPYAAGIMDIIVDKELLKVEI